MWFEWFVRRCDMGALAVAVSPVQPPSGADPHGSENTISQSAPDVATPLRRRKAERRAPTPHVFPPLPLPGSAIMANELVPPSKCMMWSPSFDNSPCKDLGYHAGPGGLKTFSISSVGDASSELGEPFVSDQKQPLNQLAKKNLQTMQELKPPLEPEQFSPRYRELKAGLWKRLAADTRCDPPKHEPCDSSSLSGTRVEPFVDGGINRSSNPATGCKKASLPRMQGHSHGRGGPLDRGPNGSVEIEVVLTGKWNVNTVEEAAMLHKPDDAKQDTSAGLGHVQNGTCNPCEKDIRHHREPNPPMRDGIDQSSTAAAVERSEGRDDDVCRTGASSREASDGESLKGGVVASHLRSCESNPQQHQHQQLQEERQKDGSECSFGSRRGIGRGRIGEDGSPTSISSNHEACEELKTSAGNMECNRKDEDGTFWSTASWCVVDSYMTGHGKETTWTVRGFEEDDGIFEENSPHFKDRNSLKLFANEKNRSRFSDLPVTQFLPIEGPDVETRHGPPPKWTQQALQERVAKNLRERQKEVRSSKNGLEIVRPAHTLTEENAEDGGRDGGECREVVLDDLMSLGDKLRCRKGRKLLKEAILKETRDKVGGGDVEASPNMNDTESASNSASWKSMPRTLNACVGPSIYRNNQEKELPVLNLIARRDIQRRKRGWGRRKAKTPAIAAACCVSMIGDTLKALRRTREDAAALALKLAELQAAEVKDFKAAASEMRTHVDSLRSEVKGLETERGFNVLMVFPWQQFLKNILIGISLLSGTLGLHRAIKSLFRLLFGQAGLAQTATSRKEKTMIAIVILCSGSYVGKEMWLMFSQVQAKKKKNEAIFQEKLLLILERLSHMSMLTYKNGPVHVGQAEESDQTVVV